MTFRKAVFYIVILVLVLIVGFSVVHKTPAAAPVVIPPTTTAPVVTSTTNYACDSAHAITANYSDGSVAVTLSDGRTLTLAQTVSADGAQYAKDSMLFVTKGDQAFLQENGSTTYANCIADNGSVAVNGMKTFTDQGKTFSITYPEAFSLAGGGIGYTEQWKVNSDDTLGLILATLNSPVGYQSKTNLGDVKLSIGTSSDPAAVKSCLVDNSGLGATKSTVTINGVKFTKLVTVDAGAGNRYETDSYRTVKNDQCYAVEYTIHYAVLENFDKGSGITAFDTKQVHADFDGIVKSFAFLTN